MPMTWGEFKKMRDDSFYLEVQAFRRVTGRTLADTARSLNPDSFDFDEWEMPEGIDLYDEEIIDGLAEYLADCLTDGEGYRLYSVKN